MYINRPIKEYLDDLGAKRSTPGGGSAAALTAATGTGLMLMAARYSVKKSDGAVEGKITDIITETQKFDSEFRALIDGDILAYKKLLEGLKSASGNDAKSDELYKAAAQSPYMVCEIAGKCMKLCLELAGCGNKNLITDTAIAAVLFDAAFLAAKFNVYVNLKYIKDMDYIAKIHNALSRLESDLPKLKEDILEICEDSISS